MEHTAKTQADPQHRSLTAERKPRPASELAFVNNAAEAGAQRPQRNRMLGEAVQLAGHPKAADLLLLQRTIGNHAVGRLLAQTTQPQSVHPLEEGMPVNDDEGTEQEAEVMGVKAAVVGHRAVPSRFFQGRAEPSVPYPEREPIHGQGEKESLNFLSSAAVERTTLVPREAASAATAALDRHGGALQRATNYNTHDRMTIVAMVDDSANPMTMTGSLRQGATMVVDINGSLEYSEKTIPMSAVSNSIFASGTVPVLEIKTINAEPQGRRIGQILAWHLARLAKARGIRYVTAGNITAARDRFYTPLGFVDFKKAPSWAWLVKQKADLEQQMKDEVALPDAIVTEYNKVLKFMEANKVFIAADKLETNALAAWETTWEKA